MLGALAALCGVGLVAGLVYLPVWLQRNDPPPSNDPPPAAQAAAVEVPDATLVGRHAGRKVWQIHAARVRSSADGQTTTFVGLDRGTLYHEGRSAARVAAGEAVYRANRRTLDATDVRLSAGGLTLQAPDLHWSAESGRMHSRDVAVTWEGGAASAGELEADTRPMTITGRNVRMAANMEGEMATNLAKRLGAASAAGGASLALFLASAPAPRAEDAPVRYREVRVRGDVWRYNQAERTHVYSGNIVATHGDTTLRADRIAYNEAANTATVTGNIRVENARNDIRGQSASVDFDRRIIVLRGDDSVRLVVRPAPEAGQEQGLRARIREPLTLDCRAITYNYRTKNADAEGPVKVTRRQQVVTGDRASYAAAPEIITLTGNVRGRDEKNQTFEAPSVKVSLAEGAEWMEAPDVRATFYVREDDGEDDPPDG